jgi:hypothetical protein
VVAVMSVQPTSEKVTVSQASPSAACAGTAANAISTAPATPLSISFFMIGTPCFSVQPLRNALAWPLLEDDGNVRLTDL